jgi:hypothetical protein
VPNFLARRATWAIGLLEADSLLNAFLNILQYIDLITELEKQMNWAIMVYGWRK